MTTILFFDTETTGIPIWSEPSEHPGQPRITQLAAELFNEETGEVLGAVNFLIKPDDWKIPQDLQDLTGITMDKANKFGVPMEYAMRSFISLWEASDVRCAHNEPFDARMVRIELMRDHLYGNMVIGAPHMAMPFPDHWKKGPAYCTQGNSTKICNLPPTAKMIAAKRNTPKSPNLGEAYEFFTGKKLEGAHNAQVDIMACKDVYFGIKNYSQAA